MATDTDGDKRLAEKRNVWGPRPVGALVPGLTRPAFRGRSPAAAQLLSDWAAVVGPALAAVTQPRRLSGATLTLACSGPIAMELQHMSNELIARINGHLGRAAVSRLRFVQQVLPTPAAPASGPAHSVEPPALPGIAPGKLHDALSRLGQAIRQADG